MFIVSAADTLGAIAADVRATIGFTDGTNHRSIAIYCLDGQASTSTHRNGSDGAPIYVDGVGSAAFVEWITDGVRLSHSGFPDGNLVTVHFFTDADVTDAKVFHQDLGSTTSQQEFTSMGFELDAMFLAQNYISSFAGYANAPLGFGCVINDNPTTPTQKSIAWCADSGSSSGDQNTRASDSEALIATLIGSTRWRLTISDIDSAGFSFTNSGSTGTQMIGLALKFAPGVELALVDSQIPTTGDYSQAGVGFEPEFGVMAHIVGPSAYNTLDTGGNGASFSITSFDDAAVYSNSFSDHDGAATTVCKSLTAGQFRLLENDGTDAVVASGHSFDADGWDFPLTTNPSNPILGWAFAYSSGGAPATGPDLLLGAAGV